MGRTVSVSLRAEIGDFVGKLGTALRSAKQFGDELGGLGKKSPKALNDVAFAAGGAGVALLGMAGYAVKTAMDFDKQMSAVSAATKASAADMNSLRAAAMQAGKDTIFSATGAAQAQTELAKAGVSVKDILGGGLTGALSLAAAGTMDVGDAAEIAATAMNQFGLSGAQIPHVADLLAAGAGKAQGEVSDMGMALKQSGLVAHQYGISIEETTGTLASFASAGLIGSDAGTSFKTMLLALANPTKKAQTQLDQLGISAYDAQGQFVGIADLAGQLQTKMAGLSQEERNAALSTIFGSDAIRAANVLYQQGSTGVQDWTRKVDDQGFAADQAARKTDNLAGDLERLKGSFETLAISAGSGANVGLRTLAKGADAAVTAFTNMPGPIQATLTVLAGVGGVALLATAGFLKMKQTVDDGLEALRGMGPSGEKAATGLGKVGSAAKNIGLLAVAAGIAWEAAGLISHLTGFDKEIQVTTRDVDKMSAALKEFAGTGKVVGELQASFGKDLSGIKAQSQAIADLGKQLNSVHKMSEGLSGAILNASGAGPQAMSQGMEAKLAQYKENIDALDKGLANLVNNGNATAAKVALENIASAAGISVDQLLAKLPGYRSAMDGAKAGNNALAQGMGNTSENARTMAASLDSAVASGQSLKQVFDQLNGVMINSLQAEIGVEDAIDKLSESLKQNHAALNANKDGFDLNSAAGRENATAMIAVAEKARDVAQAKYTETGSLEQAKGAYDGYIGRLKQTLSQAGMTQGQVDLLVGSIAQMPPVAQTQIRTPGLPQARADVAEHSRGLDRIDGRVVNAYVNTPGLSGETALLDQYRRNLDALNGRSAYTYVNTVYRESGTPTRGFSRIPGERWGGAFEHAAVGKLRDAALYTSTNPGRYMIAEPETGGEAFVPKYGNRSRSLGILAKAASWYGANISTGGTGGGYVDSRTQVFNIHDATDPNKVIAAIKSYEKSNGTVWRTAGR